MVSFLNFLSLTKQETFILGFSIIRHRNERRNHYFSRTSCLIFSLTMSPKSLRSLKSFSYQSRCLKYYPTPHHSTQTWRLKLPHPGTAEWEDCGWRDGWDPQADPWRTVSVNWPQHRGLNPDADPPLLLHQTSSAGSPQSGRCRLLWTDPPDEDLMDCDTTRET